MGFDLRQSGITIVPTFGSSGGTGGHPLAKPLPLNQIKDLQQELQKTFGQLMPNTIPLKINATKGMKHLVVPAKVREIHLYWDDAEERPKKDDTNGPKFLRDRPYIGKIHRAFLADWKDMFWLAASGLLEIFGPSLRKCKECGTIYTQTKRKFYCSRKCSQRVRSRRWYRTHGQLIVEKRHEAYVKRVHKKDPKAKVQRYRPRQASDYLEGEG
jgi:hypothetical protein